MTSTKAFHRILIVLSLLFATGCVTERGVQRVIADYNVAVIAPYALDDPSAAIKDDSWKQTVKKLDILIQQYDGTGQEALVAQLKVRQAMLLTINQQDALASHRWETINRSDLRTERDRALLDAHPALVWAYVTLPLDDKVTLSKADEYVATLDDAISHVSNRNLLDYLHYVRAQIQIRAVNGLDEDKEKEEAVRRLKESLAKFVDAFTKDQQDWVKVAQPSGGAIEKDLSDFRERIWLRDMIRKYREEGVKYEIAWSPTWVKDVPMK